MYTLTYELKKLLYQRLGKAVTAYRPWPLVENLLPQDHFLVLLFLLPFSWPHPPTICVIIHVQHLACNLK